MHGSEGAEAAGKVIHAFGDVLIGNNYLIGFVVFAILIIINFVVITKGAGRISEVTARFTLDAMPGKQMAIDADLNAGLITQDVAKARRKDVAAEAEFYGSMDGTSKFVKGDAIAGILIMVINLVFGLILLEANHRRRPCRADPLAPPLDFLCDNRHEAERVERHGKARPRADVLRAEAPRHLRRDPFPHGHCPRHAARAVPPPRLRLPRGSVPPREAREGARGREGEGPRGALWRVERDEAEAEGALMG